MPHRFPQVRKHRESLGALEDHIRSEKAPSPLRFAGAVQNAGPNDSRAQLVSLSPMSSHLVTLSVKVNSCENQVDEIHDQSGFVWVRNRERVRTKRRNR